MRNTESEPNTEFTISLSCRALARSWPNGFSITTRRHGRRPSGPVGGEDSPERLSCATTSVKNFGGTDR